MSTQQLGADQGENLKRRAALAVAACFVLASCGGGGREDTSSGNVVKIVVNTPQTIAQASADNYDDNVNGLVTAATLKRWMSNWTANRPAGISGKLVIFQATVGPTGAEKYPIWPSHEIWFTGTPPSSRRRLSWCVLNPAAKPPAPVWHARHSERPG